VKVQDLTTDEHVERELALVKVACTSETRADIIQLVNVFRARVIDVDLKTLTVEVVGDARKTEALIELLRSFGIRELVRTGRVAILRH